MLPARHRMRDSREFSATVRRGRRAGRPTVVVHLLRDPVEDAERVRVGLVVSRAVGPAVVRNRVKRRLRAILAQRVAAMPLGCRVVVRANPSSGPASFETLLGDVDSALSRLGVTS